MPTANGLSAAVGFLQRMTDRETAEGPRLPQSWASIPGTSWIYDAALTALALDAAGDRARAGDIVAALLERQEPDGRLRDTYPTNATSHAPASHAPTGASSTGNQAWAGLAMLALGELQAAKRIAAWVAERPHDGPPGDGVTGGLDASGRARAWKSTEHNAEAFALFRALGEDHAAAGCLRFLHSMRLIAVPPSAARLGSGLPEIEGEAALATGTLDDGVTVNPSPIPLDAQLMPALASDEFAGAADWAQWALSASDAGIEGLAYSDADRTGVWLEGCCQFAALRGGTAALWAAQQSDGALPAATRPLRTGFGDTIPDDAHTGTTAWAVLAALGVNPLRPATGRAQSR